MDELEFHGERRGTDRPAEDEKPRHEDARAQRISLAQGDALGLEFLEHLRSELLDRLFAGPCRIRIRAQSVAKEREVGVDESCRLRTQLWLRMLLSRARIASSTTPLPN